MSCSTSSTPKRKNWWGHEDHSEFLWDLLVVLAPYAFRQQGYFEVYIKYMEDRCQAQAEGKNLELVEFILLVVGKDNLCDAETPPLHSEEATLNGEGHEDEAHEDNSDEDPGS